MRSLILNQSSVMQEIQGQVSAVQVFPLPSCESWNYYLPV